MKSFYINKLNRLIQW